MFTKISSKNSSVRNFGLGARTEASATEEVRTGTVGTPVEEEAPAHALPASLARCRQVHAGAVPRRPGGLAAAGGASVAGGTF